MLKLTNTQPWPNGLDLGDGISVRLAPNGIVRELTADEEARLRKRYSLDTLSRFGIMYQESVSSPKIATTAAPTPAVVAPVEPPVPAQQAAEDTDEATPAPITLRDIQALIKKGMTRQDAEKWIAAEEASTSPRPTVLKELRKVLK